VIIIVIVLAVVVEIVEVVLAADVSENKIIE
jgi:hypothetical protein